MYRNTTCALPVLRVIPAIASMAKGDTMNQLYSNVWRAVSLPLACVVLWLGGGVILIAICSLVAEIVATFVSFVRLYQRQGVPLRDAAGPTAFVFCFVTAGSTLMFFAVSHWGYGLAATAVTSMLAVSVLVAWFAFPNFARTGRSLVTDLLAITTKTSKVASLTIPS